MRIPISGIFNTVKGETKNNFIKNPNEGGSPPRILITIRRGKGLDLVPNNCLRLLLNRTKNNHQVRRK
jgi:hypothetical protein